MRIISRFRDFYDCIQRAGQDRELLYLREPKTLEGALCLTTSLSGGAQGCDLESGVVVFCERAYPFLVLGVDETRHRSRESHTYVCWSVDDLDTAMAASFRKRAVEEYRGTKLHRGYFDPSQLSFGRRAAEIFFAEAATVSAAARRLTEEHRTPVIVSRTRETFGTRGETIINGELQSLEFMRVVDPFTAFQEIAMWLGAQAWPGNAIPAVSDIDMVAAKGFDTKWSFRKEPTKGR